MKIVVDHVAGSRRGQRQELELADRLRFGRHPDNEVAFDAHSDLDASSRHAELRRTGQQFTFRDVGSSNGTFVDGQRVTELTIEVLQPVLVEFGEGGPRVRIFIGDAAALAALPRIEDVRPVAPASRPGARAIAVALLVLIGAVMAAIWWRFFG